jgi:hypothetical protein
MLVEIGKRCKGDTKFLVFAYFADFISPIHNEKNESWLSFKVFTHIKVFDCFSSLIKMKLVGN